LAARRRHRLTVNPRPVGRPDLLQARRPRRGSAPGSRGLEVIPVGATGSPPPAGVWNRGAKSAGVRSESRWRSPGTLRYCPTTVLLPCRCVRPVGAARWTTRGAPRHTWSTRLEADRPELATTAGCPGLLEALGRNVSRGLVDVALFAIRAGGPSPPSGLVLSAPSPGRSGGRPLTRSPHSTPRLPRQPQHVAAVTGPGCASPRGPWGPGRRVEASDAFRSGANHRSRQRL